MCAHMCVCVSTRARVCVCVRACVDLNVTHSSPGFYAVVVKDTVLHRFQFSAGRSGSGIITTSACREKKSVKF